MAEETRGWRLHERRGGVLEIEFDAPWQHIPRWLRVCLLVLLAVCLGGAVAYAVEGTALGVGIGVAGLALAIWVADDISRPILVRLDHRALCLESSGLLGKRSRSWSRGQVAGFERARFGRYRGIGVRLTTGRLIPLGRQLMTEDIRSLRLRLEAPQGKTSSVGRPN